MLDQQLLPNRQEEVLQQEQQGQWVQRELQVHHELVSLAQQVQRVWVLLFSVLRAVPIG